MSQRDISAGGRLESLQLLRGVAAALVVYVHAFDTFRDKVDPTASLTTAVGLGELGVKIFFCISGFIIFESIQNLTRGAPSLIQFAKKRLIRIIPLYWLATLIYASKQALTGSPPNIRDLLFSLLFIPYPDANGLMRPVIGAGWTLNFEMLFYSAAAITILFSKNVRATLLVVAMGSLAVLEGVIPQGINTFIDAASLVTSDYLLFFLAGIFCSAANQHMAANRTHTSVFSLLIPAVLVGVFIATTNKLGLPANLHLVATLALCVSCVWTSTLYRGEFQTDSADSFHFRARKISVAAGDGSYGTYLTHGFVMGPCARIVKAAEVDISPTVFAIIMVVICSIIGALIFIHIEKPFQRILNRRFIGKPSLKPAI